MQSYLTTGQTAKQLRISVSTLKRWIKNGSVTFKDRRNINGWKLFSRDDVLIFEKHVKRKRPVQRMKQYL